LRRDLRLIAGCTLVAVAAAVVLVRLIPPKYESTLSLHLASRDQKAGLLAELSPLAGLGLPGLGDDEIETDIDVMRSRQIAEAVADSLALHVELRAPRVARDSILTVLRAPRDAPEGIYTLTLGPDGAYTLRAEKTSAQVELPPRVVVGRPFSIGAVEMALAPSIAAAPPRTIRLVVHPFRESAEALQEALDVRRGSGRSKLVQLRYRNRDPVLAADVLNSAGATFIAYKTRTGKVEARSTVEVLREQIAEYEAQLRLAEEALRGYRERHQVISVPDQAAAQIKQLAEFQTQRDALVIERQSLTTLLDRIARGGEGSSAAYRRLATFPSFLTNPAVQDILQSLIELENERAKLLVLRTASNADVAGLTERIHELERQLYRLASDYRDSLDGQIAASERMLERFGGTLAEVPEREVQFARLAREQKLLTEVYTLLQTRLKEAEVQEAIERGDARIVDPALIPEEPATPKPLLSIVLAAVLGVLGGAGIAVGRAVADPRLRSTLEAAESIAPAPLLGALPAPSADDAAQRRAFREVWTALALARTNGAHETIAVAGIDTDADSAHIAVGLASAAARQGYRTALVAMQDGALPPYSAEQVQEASVAFADLLLGRPDAKELVPPEATDDAAGGFDLIRARRAPGPQGELTEERVARGLARLREQYDIVILSTPPLAESHDGALLADAAGGALVVLRIGATDRAALDDALDRLRQFGVPVLGGVVIEPVC